MAHMCDFPLNDLTHEFDSLTGGHAVTLPPGSVLNRSSWHADWGVFNLGASVSRREGGVRLCGYRERSLGSSPADLPSAGPGPSGPLNNTAADYLDSPWACFGTFDSRQGSLST